LISITPSKYYSKHRIIGEVKIQVEAIKDTSDLILDTKKLDIKSVTDNKFEPLTFKFDDQQSSEALGKPLVITFPQPVKAGENRIVVIRYITQPDGDAAQWLTADMTLGKKYPFMYTQGEAILNRTLLPCQDSPAVKVNVKGRVTVPKPLVGLVAGIQQYIDEDENTRTFYYEVPLPIPTYLITIAAGNLQNRKISERSSVYAEPEIVDKAKKEFEDTEKFIQTVISFLI
jgi:leukotriene-A4 hydrolase